MSEEKSVQKQFIVEQSNGESESTKVEKTEVLLCALSSVNTEPNGDNAHGNRKFDAVKVARIKAQLARGEYEINPARIVSKFIDCNN